MSPLDQLDRARAVEHLASPKGSLPPLESGDELTREEFEARYEAMPENVKAELLEGVVYVSSPTKTSHGSFSSSIITWLGNYKAATPGCQCLDNTSLRLDKSDEPQPDALLRIVHEAGGASWIDEEQYLNGAVELVVEVAVSSASRDLNKKKRCYLRHGILEYLVAVLHSNQILAFARQSNEFVPLLPDRRGVICSRVFAGLWLDTRALLAHDDARLLATLDRGLTSEAHATFARERATRLRRGRRRRS